MKDKMNTHFKKEITPILKKDSQKIYYDVQVDISEGVSCNFKIELNDRGEVFINLKDSFTDPIDANEIVHILRDIQETFKDKNKIEGLIKNEKNEI